MQQVPLKKIPVPLLALFAIIIGFYVSFPTSMNVAKTIHIVAIVSWFAGLFYLPRLFVYHAEAAEEPVKETLKIMEWKLFYFIMNPAVCVSLFSGFWMISLWGWNFPIWLHLKLSFVLTLLLFHLYCWKLVGVFNQEKNCRTGKFYRVLNEVPTLLLIIIVYLVVTKPLQ
jgi:protoporphyrinogen IX oxidase